MTEKPQKRTEPKAGKPDAPPWTSRPWEYQPIPGYQYVVEIDKKAQILLVAAAVPAGREEEMKANCRLAATAPEGYKLAELVVKYFGDDEIPDLLTCDIRLRDAARTLITKARGASITPDPGKQTRAVSKEKG